jgi:hypothetical protein
MGMICSIKIFMSLPLALRYLECTVVLRKIDATLLISSLPLLLTCRYYAIVRAQQFSTIVVKHDRFQARSLFKFNRC